MRTKLLVTLILALTSAVANAFDGEKCSKLFPSFGDDHPPYFGVFYVSTMFPSTTSYVSSFGKCAMYGSSPYATSTKRAYVKGAYRHLQVDAARGEGEYISTLAFMSGCQGEDVARFNSKIQSNYGMIFDPSNNNDPQAVLNRIDSLSICRSKM